MAHALAQSVAGAHEVTGRNLGTTGPTRRFGDHQATSAEIYLAIVAMLVAATIALWRIRRGRPGRALAVMRSSADAAAATGISVGRLRVKVFVIGAAITGVAGAASAVSLRFVDPSSIGLPRSIEFATVAIVGGAVSPFGAAVGALFVRALPEAFSSIADYQTLFVGVAFLMVIRRFGGGLSSAVDRWWSPASAPARGLAVARVVGTPGVRPAEELVIDVSSVSVSLARCVPSTACRFR